MAIYLIRHGETAGNASRVVQVPETPLSARGLEQAERLARRLREAGIGAILSSDLTRAAMTAERLGAATGLPVAHDPGLQERDFGDVRGRAYADLEREGVELFGPDYAPPGGETWEAFHVRVAGAWARVLETASHAEGHLAVVTHGLVKHAVVSRHLPVVEGVAAGRIVPFANTALTHIEGPPWAVRLLGCVAHLEDVAPGGGAV